MYRLGRTVVQLYSFFFAAIICSVCVEMKVPVLKRAEYNRVISRSRISPFLHRRGRRSRASSYGSASKCKSVQRNKVLAVAGLKCSTKRKMASAQLQMGAQHVQRGDVLPEGDHVSQQQQPADVVVISPGRAQPKTPAKSLPKTPGKAVSKTPGKKAEAAKKGDDVTRKRKASVAEQAAAKRKDKVEVEMKG